MTQHPGFASVALCPWNLQAVYSAYKTTYGDMTQNTPHE